MSRPKVWVLHGAGHHYYTEEGDRYLSYLWVYTPGVRLLRRWAYGEGD